MANDTEFALSAVRAGEGIRFTPSSAVTAVHFPADGASPSLTQREASRTGSGWRSKIHLQSQDLEELITYLSFIFTFFPQEVTDCVLSQSHALGKEIMH